MELGTREMAHYMAKMYDWNIRSSSRGEINEDNLAILERKRDKWLKQENLFLSTLKIN